MEDGFYWNLMSTTCSRIHRPRSISRHRPKENLNSNKKGKKLYVQLPDSLKAATTYTLNFGPSITDLTEGNVQNRFKYVFSTGTFIDSFLVQIGRDAYTQKAKKNMTGFLTSFPTA